MSKELEFETSNTQQTELQSNGKMKQLLGYFHLFASPSEFPAFDARKKWASHEGDKHEKCPMIRRVVNSGKCKCGWVLVNYTFI